MFLTVSAKGVLYFDAAEVKPIRVSMQGTGKINTLWSVSTIFVCFQKTRLVNLMDHSFTKKIPVE